MLMVLLKAFSKPTILKNYNTLDDLGIIIGTVPDGGFLISFGGMWAYGTYGCITKKDAVYGMKKRFFIFFHLPPAGSSVLRTI